MGKKEKKILTKTQENKTWQKYEQPWLKANAFNLEAIFSVSSIFLFYNLSM